MRARTRTHNTHVRACDCAHVHTPLLLPIPKRFCPKAYTVSQLYNLNRPPPVPLTEYEQRRKKRDLEDILQVIQHDVISIVVMLCRKMLIQLLSTAT